VGLTRPRGRGSVTQRNLFVFHGADEVAFGVVEIDSGADGGDVKLRHRDGASGGFDGADDGVDPLDADRAFETGHGGAVVGLAAFVEQTLDAGVGLIAGVDEVEVGRSPRFEAPSEDLFVEKPGACDVVGSDPKAS